VPQRDPKATQRSGEAKAKATSRQKRRGGAQIHTQIGSYTILKPLAKGGMAQIYQVRDERDKHIKALKLLHPTMSTDEALARFRREFRALSAIQHENILKVFEWGLHGNQPWYSMEFIEGQSLRDTIESWDELEAKIRFPLAEKILLQLARALACIHDRGVIHRDLTPANVMVLPDGSIKLMDFGIIKEQGTELTAVGDMVGTVAFIAPEQVSGEAVDARTDLYALGAVLYMMLTGSKPFSALTLQGYLEKALHHSPRAPREIEPLLPKHLNDVCLRLLNKAPADRFASANHLLHVLGELEPLTPGTSRWPPATVGRLTARTRIRHALEVLSSREQGEAIILDSAPGMGTSRLLELSTVFAHSRGFRVAQGQCRPHDRPFGAFVSVYHDLAGEDPPAILQSALGSTAEEEVTHERYAVISAFRDFIVSNAPCVIVLDDLQSADPATAEMLSYLIRNTLELESVPVVYLIGHETVTDNAQLHTSLQHSAAVTRLTLPPLIPSEVEELLLSFLENTPAVLALARRMHEESLGSPAYISDILRSMIQEGLITQTEDQYRLTLETADITSSHLPMPASLRQALQERIAPLTPHALTVARTLAIARHPIDLDVLIDATDLEEETILQTVDDLIDMRIVDEKRNADNEQLELHESRIREVLLHNLSGEERRLAHQRMGEALEKHHRSNPGFLVEELATHFEQAKMAPKAFTYLLSTAKRHHNRSLYEESLSFLNRALRMEEKARPFMVLDDADAKLAELEFRRSQALYQLGRWEKAAQTGRRALDIARPLNIHELLSRIAAHLGFVLRQTGDTTEAKKLLIEALHQADIIGDARLRPMPLYHLGALAWAAGDMEECEKVWHEALDTATKTKNDRARGFGYNGLGILCLCGGDSISARKHLERSAKLFEGLGMLGPLSIVRVNLVELYICTGILRKALALAERTIAQAREVHHPHGIALGLTYRASVLLQLKRNREARQNAGEAKTIMEELGQREDQVHALATLVQIDLIEEQADQAQQHLHQLQSLLTKHDSEGIASMARAWQAQCFAMQKQRSKALVTLTEGNQQDRRWPYIQIRTDLAMAQAWKSLGENDTAREHLQHALQLAEANSYRYYQLLAHHGLQPIAQTPKGATRHQRVAQALARSIAANLPGADSKSFRSATWGQDA
jgi:serine/threonine protein kinase/tetratricopeptide (TPR) repeat protein